MKYYIIAGEASGDLHGAKLIKAIKQKDSHAEFRAWGGDQMSNAGANLVKHYRDLAFMGLVEVLLNIRTIFSNIKYCQSDIEQYHPDALILIDYSGFNLRIAEWAANHSFKTLYYISPQVWAWRTHRVKKIKAFVDRMYVILPFEKAFYQKHQYEVEFVGHPLLDVVAEYQPNPDFHATYQLDPNRPVVALLPGSRKQEIKRMLKTMLTLVNSYPDYQFVIGGAPAIDHDFYANFIPRQITDSVKVISQQTYDLLSVADFAIVTSGTATLEAALFEVPQIVCYRGNNLSYFIVRNLVAKNIKFISLVNLVLNKMIIKELIQFEYTPDQLAAAFESLVQTSQNNQINSEYKALKVALGHQGAAERAATSMVHFLSHSKA